MVDITEIFNKNYLKNNRKNLRKNLTLAEAGLWKYLKNSQLGGKKFRRQHSIGNYIVDFYCPEERLAIELDGEVHHYDHIHIQDSDKQNYLMQNRIKILRFENKLVFEQLEWVLKRIMCSFSTTPSR